jgi:hypothetical protein
MVVGAGIVVAVAVLVLFGGPTLETEALGSTQQCNTECQEKMTDCIQRCDVVLGCELACKAAAVGCVAVCTSDAGRAVVRELEGGARAPVEDAAVAESGRAAGRRDAGRGDGRAASSTRDR